MSGMDDTDPETMVQAIAHLKELGYDHDLDIRDAKLMMRSDDGYVPFAGTEVDHVYRFEGETNPSDESIVLGISGGDDGARGVLVSSYGPDAAEGHDIVLGELDLGDRWR